jgi:hypothetical protein
MLNVIDEFTRECLAIGIDWRLKSTDFIDVLSDLFMPHAAFRAISDPTTSYVAKELPLEASDHWASERPDTLKMFAQAGSAVKKRSLP